MNTEAALHTLCKSLASEAIRNYCQFITPVQYLYGRLADEGPFCKTAIAGTYVELRINRERLGSQFELVISEHIPRHLEVLALKAWFLNYLRRAPILNCLETEEN